MPILKVARLGHPVLRQQAQALTRKELASSTVQQLIDNMIDTMREYEGVGLAAPQVHESKSIFVMEVAENERYPDAPAYGLKVFVNPQLSFPDPEQDLGWEGCLSIPNMRGLVPRYKKLHIKAWDRDGKDVALTVEGFPAIVMQHEADHLAGVVYLDRMRDLTALAFDQEYERYWVKDEETEAEPIES